MRDGDSMRTETTEYPGLLPGQTPLLPEHSGTPLPNRSDISVMVLPAKNLTNRQAGSHWFTDETALAFLLGALAQRDSLDVVKYPSNITRIKLWPQGKWAELGMPGKGYVEHTMTLDLLLPYTLQQLEAVGPIIHLRPGPLLPGDDPAITVSLGRDLSKEFPPGCDLSMIQIHTIEVTDLGQGWAVPLVLTVKTGEEDKAKWEEQVMRKGSKSGDGGSMFDAVAAQARIYQEVHKIWLDPLCSYITLNPGVVVGAGDTVGISKANLTMEMRRPFGPWAPDRLVGRTGNLTAEDLWHGLMPARDMFLNAPGFIEYMEKHSVTKTPWISPLDDWILVPPEHLLCPDLIYAIGYKEEVSTLLLTTKDGEAVNLLAYIIHRVHVEMAIKFWVDNLGHRRVLTDLSQLRITVSSANGPRWLPEPRQEDKKRTGVDSLEETLRRQHGALAIRLRFGMRLFPTDRSTVMPVNGETIRPTVFSSKNLLARVFKRILQRKEAVPGAGSETGAVAGQVKETKRKTTEADKEGKETVVEGPSMQVVDPDDLEVELGEIHDEEEETTDNKKGEDRDEEDAVGLFQRRQRRKKGD